MENDLASRIASKLESGGKGRAKQRLDVRDRLKVWVGGRALCDSETATVIPDIARLRLWHMTEGLGRLGFEAAADLWADVMQVGDRVELGVWRIGNRWYYDTKTGSLHFQE